MDLKALEVEAQEAALRQVAQMLQRPDQLEKLDQYKKKTTRKKVSFLSVFSSLSIRFRIVFRPRSKPCSKRPSNRN